jgi:hypothetical protein
MGALARTDGRIAAVLSALKITEQKTAVNVSHPSELGEVKERQIVAGQVHFVVSCQNSTDRIKVAREFRRFVVCWSVEMTAPSNLRIRGSTQEII